jgi:predicted ATP-grasp superfamily ATP-dependent carboligase
MGWIAACVLVGMLLPLLGMLYIDILEARHEARHQQEKVQKLIKQFEKEKKDASPNRSE